MEKELYNHPFSLSLSKADPRMVRQAHHERNEDICGCITYAGFNSRIIGRGESEGEIMAKILAEMTADELKQLVGLAVEEKLIELLGDPDEGLVLRESLRKRLLQQKRAVAKGERGELLEDVVRRLKLA
jgi:hypothetical protein